jgi:hypothetical protein
MSTDRGAQTALTGYRNRQTTSADLDCLDKPGDCRSCGAEFVADLELSEEVLRVAGDNDDRVDACPNCFTVDGRGVQKPVEAAQRAHRDPTWPRDLGGGE